MDRKEQCDSPVLVGLDDICAYIKRSKPVVRRMIKSGEIPVVLKHGAHMTTTHLLQQWLADETKRIDTQVD